MEIDSVSSDEPSVRYVQIATDRGSHFVKWDGEIYVMVETKAEASLLDEQQVHDLMIELAKPIFNWSRKMCNISATIVRTGARRINAFSEK